MKLLVDTLFKSLGKLTNIIILDTYFILTFAIFGLQMYEGVTHFRCRQTKHPVFYEDTQMWDWKPVVGDFRICGSFHECEIACGSLYETELNDYDKNGKMLATKKKWPLDASIPKDRDSVTSVNNFGITKFDSIGDAYLTIFQCTTLEGWTQIKGMISDGYNIVVAEVFFVLCVLICNYFLLNLTVAVMLDKFKL